MQKNICFFSFGIKIIVALIGKLMSNHEENPRRFLIERKKVPDMGNQVELNSIYKRKRIDRVLVN